MTEVHTSKRDEQTLVGLRSREVELVVAPGVGGKLIRLLDRERGRDWMWSATPARALRPVSESARFDDSQLTGLDECLPTVAPCTLNGISLPDHGEVWNLPWSLDQQRLTSDREICTQVTLRTLPLRLTRTIALQNATVSFRYLLENLSDRPTPFAWCMHPLFAMRTDDRLSIEGVADEARVDSATGLAYTTEDRVPWRPLTEDLLAGGTSQAIKLYLSVEYEPRFVIRNQQDGTMLRGTCGPQAVLPYLGVWISRGGWNGHEHVAVEPTNVMRDRVDAVEPGDANVLQPQETRGWWVTWQIGQSA